MNPELAARKFFDAGLHGKDVRHGKGAHETAQSIQRSECDGTTPSPLDSKDGKRWLESCDGGIYGGNYKKREDKAKETINDMYAESVQKANKQ